MRIWEDMAAMLDGQIGEWKLMVVLRQWADIHPSMEFRGFVYERKLTAISSYNRAVYWPDMVVHKDAIETLLKDYWKKVEPAVPRNMSNFIVDFAVSRDLSRVFIVELNHFYDFEGNATNAELFSWDKDDDILLGRRPFEMRVLTTPWSREQLLKTITKPYKIWLGYEPEASFNAAVDHV